MRIGIDGRGMFPGMGGVGYYTLHLLRQLAALDPKSQYRVINADFPQQAVFSQAPPNFAFTNFSRAGRRLFNLAAETLGWPPVQRYLGPLDLVHFTSFADFPTAGTPHVVTIHDLAYLHYPEALSRRNLHLGRRNAPRLCRTARRVIAISEATKRDVVASFRVPPGQVTVVYNGTDASAWPTPGPEALAAARRRWGLRKPRLLLFVGTIEPRKNLPFLLDSYARFAHRADFDLVLAGSLGWGYEPVLERIRALGLAGEVHRLGYVAQEELPALYALADLFVFPSLYEGFGIPPLDAMARGVPVLAADNSSLPEIVGDAGELFALDDPDRLAELMARVVADPARLADMRARGLARAGGFTWEASAQGVLRAYREALA